MIDLRSDTVTRPSAGMRKAMHEAELGDDVFAEDPTVNQLEEHLANMMGMEEGLYCSSGTMANQIAIKVHTRPGDQVICSWAAHIYNYEGGGMAMNSGVTAKLLEGDRGLFTAHEVAAAILPDDVHFPASRMVSIEDTSNKGGGAIWPIQDIADISTLCSDKGLALHLDGARLFNRLVADSNNPQDYAKHYDTMSICLSKGLGAPVGSVLLGDRAFIHAARRVRKAFGGGMRQAGVIAAAGTYALEHNVARMAEDHLHAQQIAEVLGASNLVQQVLPVDTNIIVFDLQEGCTADQYIAALEKEGVLAFAVGPNSIRFVLHPDVSSEMVKKTLEICRKMDTAITAV